VKNMSEQEGLIFYYTFSAPFGDFSWEIWDKYERSKQYIDFKIKELKKILSKVKGDKKEEGKIRKTINFLFWFMKKHGEIPKILQRILNKKTEMFVNLYNDFEYVSLVVFDYYGYLIYFIDIDFGERYVRVKLFLNEISLKRLLCNQHMDIFEKSGLIGESNSLIEIAPYIVGYTPEVIDPLRKKLKESNLDVKAPRGVNYYLVKSYFKIILRDLFDIINSFKAYEIRSCRFLGSMIRREPFGIYGIDNNYYDTKIFLLIGDKFSNDARAILLGSVDISERIMKQIFDKFFALKPYKEKIIDHSAKAKGKTAMKPILSTDQGKIPSTVTEGKGKKEIIPKPKEDIEEKVKEFKKRINKRLESTLDKEIDSIIDQVFGDKKYSLFNQVIESDMRDLIYSYINRKDEAKYNIREYQIEGNARRSLRYYISLVDKIKLRMEEVKKLKEDLSQIIKELEEVYEEIRTVI